MSSRRRSRSSFQSPSDGDHVDTRRRRSSRISNITNNNQNLTTPATASSIRLNARLPTVAEGRQQSARYNLNYFRQRRQEMTNTVSPPTDQGVLRHAFNTAHDISNETNERICICDDKSIPDTSSCNRCDQSENRRCDFHTLMFCCLCNKRFHRGCIASLSHVSLQDLDIDTYLCPQCEIMQGIDDTPWASLGRGTNEQKLARFGLACTQTPGSAEYQQTLRTMKKLKDKLEECKVVKRSLILDNSPMPYPSAINMSEEAKKKHVLSGRRFEISMLLFKVEMCSCCGRVQPGHVDPAFPKEGVPFERKHLVNSYHPAWHCECNDFCQGSQFYAQRKKSEIDFYKEKHQGRPPWIVLGLNQQSPNAVLCNLCYKEIQSKDIEGKYNLDRNQLIAHKYHFLNTVVLMYSSLNRPTICSFIFYTQRVWTNSCNQPNTNTK